MRNQAVSLSLLFDVRGERRDRWAEDEAEMVICCNLRLGHLIVLHLLTPNTPTVQTPQPHQGLETGDWTRPERSYLCR